MMRPNILFIVTDQQSATMMSCAGNKYLSTPGMDSLAASGVRFDRAYCTNPVCIPSRFSLFTGRFPSAVGMRSNAVADEIEGEIPENIKQNGLGHLLKSAGYDAVYGGKEHLPKMSAAELGFDKFCDDEREELADACAEFIRQPHDKPFFLTASFINPHDICHMAINEYADALDFENVSWEENPGDAWVKNIYTRCIRERECVEEALRIPEGMDKEDFLRDLCPPLPVNFESQEDEPEAIWTIKNQRKFKRYAHDNFTEEQWRMHRWAYCKLTERVDAQISTVLKALRESGLENETVVLFTSDHGDMDAAHRMEHKTALYEEACRIPMIVKFPGEVPEGVVNTQHLISNGLDLLPTILDYTGIECPEELEGRSLRPICTTSNEDSSPPQWRSQLKVESEFGDAIVTDRYKYIRYDHGKSREQVMDLVEDPFEMKNSLGQLEGSDTLTELRDAAQSMFTR